MSVYAHSVSLPFPFFNTSASFSCQVRTPVTGRPRLCVRLSVILCVPSIVPTSRGEKKKCRMHRATTSIVKLFHKSASKLLVYSTEQYYNDCSANRGAVFPLSYYIFFPSITAEARGNTLCLCVVFRVTLYLKKNVPTGVQRVDYSELVQVCISNMACKRCIAPSTVRCNVIQWRWPAAMCCVCTLSVRLYHTVCVYVCVCVSWDGGESGRVVWTWGGMERIWEDNNKAKLRECK